MKLNAKCFNENEDIAKLGLYKMKATQVKFQQKYGIKIFVYVCFV